MTLFPWNFSCATWSKLYRILKWDKNYYMLLRTTYPHKLTDTNNICYDLKRLAISGNMQMLPSANNGVFSNKYILYECDWQHYIIKNSYFTILISWLASLAHEQPYLYIYMHFGNTESRLAVATIMTQPWCHIRIWYCYIFHMHITLDLLRKMLAWEIIDSFQQFSLDNFGTWIYCKDRKQAIICWLYCYYSCYFYTLWAMH